ncbi:hypothetical protein [Xenorhabdus siamensis]|uniref:hypothetical protein n=1 Tax=Xenorhabdus siamensis TaxID=3136254 RepID=UPI0030F436A6
MTVSLHWGPLPACGTMIERLRQQGLALTARGVVPVAGVVRAGANSGAASGHRWCRRMSLPRNDN